MLAALQGGRGNRWGQDHPRPTATQPEDEVMGFSDSQRRALTRKLAKRSVRSRTLSGATLRYVSGWHDALSVKRQTASKLGRRTKGRSVRALQSREFFQLMEPRQRYGRCSHGGYQLSRQRRPGVRCIPRVHLV